MCLRIMSKSHHPTLSNKNVKVKRESRKQKKTYSKLIKWKRKKKHGKGNQPFGRKMFQQIPFCQIYFIRGSFEALLRSVLLDKSNFDAQMESKQAAATQSFC